MRHNGERYSVPIAGSVKRMTRICTECGEEHKTQEEIEEEARLLLDPPIAKKTAKPKAYQDPE